jgi:hypothetical protein
MKKPETPREALTLALFLGLTAPTDAAAEEVIKFAERIAVGMSAADVTACKRNALARYRRQMAKEAA